jgi:hypothetical protein
VPVTKDSAVGFLAPTTDASIYRAECNVMRHVPVIIVGGGPVGMVLAMSLSA